jgi:3-hydroxyacyl-[acyl-carrier-protein] dehydratase
MFQDHFPGFPIVPGVVQIEMIAQVGGKCLRAALPEILTVLASVKSAKFYRSIEPGDRCEIHIDVENLRSTYAVVSGTIYVDDKRVAQATVMYGMLPATHLEPGATDFVLARWKKEQANRQQTAQTTPTEAN